MFDRHRYVFHNSELVMFVMCGLLFRSMLYVENSGRIHNTIVYIHVTYLIFFDHENK